MFKIHLWWLSCSQKTWTKSLWFQEFKSHSLVLEVLFLTLLIACMDLKEPQVPLVHPFLRVSWCPGRLWNKGEGDWVVKSTETSSLRTSQLLINTTSSKDHLHSQGGGGFQPHGSTPAWKENAAWRATRPAAMAESFAKGQQCSRGLLGFGLGH